MSLPVKAKVLCDLLEAILADLTADDKDANSYYTLPMGTEPRYQLL